MSLDELVQTLNKKYGQNSADRADRISDKFDVIPTGILALDYELGTGGWPFGYVIEIFGPPSIGKSSLIGFSAIKNAQALGHYCSYIAAEPGFDKNWAALHGVDLERLVVVEPEDGEQAFSMLKDCIDHTRLVVFDSLAAVYKTSQLKTEGAVAAVGGASSLIASGIGTVVMKAHKRNTCVILINQQRNNMDIAGVFDSPGGNAPKHYAQIRVQLRFGGSPLKLSDGAVYGHPIRATIKKNKRAEGTIGRTANFTYYVSSIHGEKIGVDEQEDVIATAMRTKTIEQRGGYYYHPLFPEGKVQGKEAVGDAVKGNPEFIAEIREGVLKAMVVRNSE